MASGREHSTARRKRQKNAATGRPVAATIILSNSEIIER
jgi:hypothetical protein